MLTFSLDLVLPQDVFDKITSLERGTRYNFPARWGVNIFGEVTPEFLKESVNTWVASQRK